MRADCAVLVGKFWRTALRPGLSADQAADAMAMMLSAHVYSMLTVDLGWSPDRYEQWIAHALAHLFLRPELLRE